MTVDLVHGPVSLFPDGFEILDSIEQLILLVVIFNVSIYEQTLSFGMHILHCSLEALEGPSFCYFDFTGELAD